MYAEAYVTYLYEIMKFPEIWSTDPKRCSCILCHRSLRYWVFATDTKIFGSGVTKCNTDYLDLPGVLRTITFGLDGYYQHFRLQDQEVKMTAWRVARRVKLGSFGESRTLRSVSRAWIVSEVAGSWP